MVLKGRTALITGGSRGIGEAIAVRLAGEGANVIINYSESGEEAEAAMKTLASGGGQRHRLVQADVGDPDQVREMMRSIAEHYPSLDMLVNNAGVTRFVDHGDLQGLSMELFDRIYHVNLRGAFATVREGEALLKKSDAPMIVNIASIAAITAVGSNIAYCAMKAALVNMTMALARALAPRIRVNAISPGLTRTELTKGWHDYSQTQVGKTPLNRLGNCSDIADAVFALATSMKFVTGQNIVVDGGRVLN